MAEILHHLGSITPCNGINYSSTGAGFLPSTVYLQNLTPKKSDLIGGFNPSEKYARQIGFIFHNFRGETSKKIFELPPPSNAYTMVQIKNNNTRMSCWYLGSLDYFTPMAPRFSTSFLSRVLTQPAVDMTSRPIGR